MRLDPQRPLLTPFWERLSVPVDTLVSASLRLWAVRRFVMGVGRGRVKRGEREGEVRRVFAES